MQQSLQMSHKCVSQRSRPAFHITLTPQIGNLRAASQSSQAATYHQSAALDSQNTCLRSVYSALCAFAHIPFFQTADLVLTVTGTTGCYM